MATSERLNRGNGVINAVDCYSFTGIFTPFTLYDTTLLYLGMYIRNEHSLCFLVLCSDDIYIVPFLNMVW